MLGLLGQTQDIDKRYYQAKDEINKLKERIKQKTDNQDPTILRTEALKNKQGLYKLSPGASFPLKRQLKGHFGKIYALHWSSNNQDIVSASRDGQLIIWNVPTTTKKLAISLRTDWVMTCAYSPDSSLIASGGTDNLLTIFDIRDAKGWNIKEPMLELKGLCYGRIII